TPVDVREPASSLPMRPCDSTQAANRSFPVPPAPCWAAPCAEPPSRSTPSGPSTIEWGSFRAIAREPRALRETAGRRDLPRAMHPISRRFRAMNGRWTLLLIAYACGATTGCAGAEVVPPPPSVARASAPPTECQRDHVYVFLVNGMDPFFFCQFNKMPA